MEKGKPLPISALPKGERPERARPESEERESQSPKTGTPKKVPTGRASAKTGKSGASAPKTKSSNTKATKTGSGKSSSDKSGAAKSSSAKSSSPKSSSPKSSSPKSTLAKTVAVAPDSAMAASTKVTSAKVTSATTTSATTTSTKGVAPVSAPGKTPARERPDADALLKLILARLDDMKAEETVTIDLKGKSTLADYMVVSSGRANRHVGAIAEHVIEDLRKVGIKGTHAEGMTNCDWVLIDAGDVIVHLFRPEVRAFYNLEKMWTAGRDARVAT